MSPRGSIVDSGRAIVIELGPPKIRRPITSSASASSQVVSRSRPFQRANGQPEAALALRVFSIRTGGEDRGGWWPAPRAPPWYPAPISALHSTIVHLWTHLIICPHAAEDSDPPAIYAEKNDVASYPFERTHQEVLWAWTPAGTLRYRLRVIGSAFRPRRHL